MTIPRANILGVGVSARLRPAGMEREDDIGDEGPDHGRAEAVAPGGRVADEVVDARGGAIDTPPPPLLGFFGLINTRIALDPADVAPGQRGDPVLGAVGRA